MKIGILEFGDIVNGKSIPHLADQIISYARKAEELGFDRFWLSEHHPKSLIWSNPMLMIMLICSQTDHIKLGSGGILSAYHSPYLMFDYFRQLATLFPKRIEIGFAKGNPAENIKKLLLNKDIIPADLPEKLHHKNVSKVSDLFKSYSTTENVLNFGFHLPDQWILSSSSKRLDLALETGSNVCLSTFHSKLPDESIKENLQVFRLKFKNKHGRYPQIMLAFTGLVGTTYERAKKRFQEITNSPYKESRTLFVGTEGQLAFWLSEWTESFEFDSFLFKDMETENSRRIKSLSIISKIL